MRYWIIWACALGSLSGCLAGSAQFGNTAQSNPITLNPNDGKSIPRNVATPFPQAAHPALLSITKGAGAVLATPAVRMVTFNNDTDAASLEDFANKLATGAYWAATTSEYGVGQLKAATAVRDTFAWPATVTDGDSSLGEPSDIETYLTKKLDGTNPPWGAADSNTIYTLMLPQGTAVSFDRTATSACTQGVLAWHTAFVLPTSKVTVHYVVVPNCGALANLTALNSRTLAASHALVEAATDPTADAYGQTDPNHLVWQMVSGSPEVASACSAQQDGDDNLVADAAITGVPYAVQRSWSNAAAAAGHAPCVPTPAGEVYFDAIPVLTDTVQVVPLPIAGALSASTAGVKLAKGANETIALNLISDAAIATPWQVTVTEVGTSVLTLTLDKAQGINGDVLHLSITVSGNPTTAQEVIKITSTSGLRSNHQYVVVHP